MGQKKIRIKLLVEMLGTVPKDPAVYKSYIETKKPDNIEEDESLTVEKTEKKGWTGFHKDEKGLFIYNYMIKGFLKNAGNVLKDIVKIKNLRSKINSYVFIFPRKIYFGQAEPDGIIERPLRAMTAQGPRVTLARSDFIKAGKEFEVEISLIPHKELKMPVIMTLFDYGKLVGLGQFRSGDYGQFEVIE